MSQFADRTDSPLGAETAQCTHLCHSAELIPHVSTRALAGFPVVNEAALRLPAARTVRVVLSEERKLAL